MVIIEIDRFPIHLSWAFHVRANFRLLHLILKMKRQGRSPLRGYLRTTYGWCYYGRFFRDVLFCCEGSVEKNFLFFFRCLLLDLFCSDFLCNRFFYGLFFFGVSSLYEFFEFGYLVQFLGAKI